MKIIFGIIFSVISFSAITYGEASKSKPKSPAGAPRMSWELGQSLENPESVYFDDESNYLFVSNVAGQPDQKDGKGWISKLTLDGQVASAEWVKGLNAPKGMRAKAGVLWVSDIDELVSINIKSGIVLNVLPVTGAKFLNDIAIDDEGAVYVSDTIGSKIYRLHDGKMEVFAEGDQLESPNGLLIRGDKLIVASWGLTRDWKTKVPGNLYSIDLKTKQKTPITKRPTGNLDGLEMDTDGDYLVSDWVAGKLFRIKQDGSSTLLLQGFKGSADIGFVARSRTLIVPRMGENKLTAYELGEVSGNL
jgi:sugar lactone lactonase YvrE